MEVECHAVDVSHSMQVAGVATDLWSHTTATCQHQSVTTTATDMTHNVLNVPSAKAEFCLKISNVLLRNLCVRHGLQKYFPGGRLETLALTPFDQTGLHSFLYVSGMVLKTCPYCGFVKPHPLKNCPPLVSSSSAHMLS